MQRIDLNEIIVVDKDTAERVDIVGCYRFTGQACPAGTRVDLRCAECGHRVATDPNTVRFHAAGAKLVCQVCFLEATASP